MATSPRPESITQGAQWEEEEEFFDVREPEESLVESAQVGLVFLGVFFSFHSAVLFMHTFANSNLFIYASIHYPITKQYVQVLEEELQSSRSEQVKEGWNRRVEAVLSSPVLVSPTSWLDDQDLIIQVCAGVSY